MSKYWNVITWVGGFALLLVLGAFSQQRHRALQHQKLDIQIDYSTKQYFVTKSEVEEIIRQEYPFLDSMMCREINITLLEETLDNHPSIRKAEVYSALNGILNVQVLQKQPCYRVHNSMLDYYIAEQGDSMALSANYSANVPLVTGSVSVETKQKMFDFFHILERDQFFDNFFTGIDVDSNGDWLLYPIPGRHKVFFGKPENVEEKLRKLKVFYQKAIGTDNIDSIASLNLAFDHQVICKKH